MADVPPLPKTIEPPPVKPPGAGGPLPPSVTPGWNDPPELSTYSPSSGPKRLLNKRVAFPLSTTSSPSQSPAANAANTMHLPPMPVNDSALTQIMNSFTQAINELPNNSGLLKDMERFTTNWRNICNNQTVVDLLLKASVHVRSGDLEQSEVLRKELSDIPAAEWFTSFLHSIIMSITSQRTNL